MMLKSLFWIQVGEFVLLWQQLAGRWLIKWEEFRKVNHVIRPCLVPSLSSQLSSQLQPLDLRSHFSPISKSVVLKVWLHSGALAALRNWLERQILKPPPQTYRIRNSGDGPNNLQFAKPSRGILMHTTVGVLLFCPILLHEQLQKISSAVPWFVCWFYCLSLSIQAALTKYCRLSTS